MNDRSPRPRDVAAHVAARWQAKRDAEHAEHLRYADAHVVAYNQRARG